MDLATLLTRVDGRQVPTVKAFLDAAALIPAGEQQFWGGAPEGVREVSRTVLAHCACCATMHAPGELQPGLRSALRETPCLAPSEGCQRVRVGAHAWFVRLAVLLPVTGFQGARDAGRGEAAGGAPHPSGAGSALRGDPCSGRPGAPAARCHAG